MNRLLPFVISITTLFHAACGDDDDDDVVVFDAGVDAQLVDAGGIDVVDPAGCRGSDECDDQAFRCVGPNDTNCGVAPRQECENDDGCGKFAACHVVVDACSPDGFGSECAAPCADNCAEGLVCSKGHCRPVVCASDADCPDSQRCDPKSIDLEGPVHAITAGCITIECKDDEPCPNDTVCVNGYCQDGLGECMPPAP